MGIVDPFLKKLAGGRTEITTKMICEAERLMQDAYNREYLKLEEASVYQRISMQNYYDNLYRYSQAQYAGHNGIIMHGIFGSCLGGYYQTKKYPCPYCGR